MQYLANDTRAWDDKFAVSDTNGQAIMVIAKMWAESMEPNLEAMPGMDMWLFGNMGESHFRQIWPWTDELQGKKMFFAIIDVLVRYGWRFIPIAGPYREGLQFEIEMEEAERHRNRFMLRDAPSRRMR